MRQLKVAAGITPRDSESIVKYLNELSSIEYLTPEEETSIAMKYIKTRDIKYRNRLIEANLRFVVTVAKQYQTRGCTLEDLINEGNLGMTMAAERFDPTRGFKFISYAVWWIRQTIQVFLIERALIKRPENIMALIREYLKENNNSLQSTGMPKNLEEFLDERDRNNKNTRAIITDFLGVAKSVDEPQGDDYDTSYGDTLINEDRADRGVFEEDTKIAIMHSLKKVLVRERDLYVVIHYFGLGTVPESLNAMAEDLNLSRERVRQILENSIQKVKVSKYAKHLKEYIA